MHSPSYSYSSSYSYSKFGSQPSTPAFEYEYEEEYEYNCKMVAGTTSCRTGVSNSGGESTSSLILLSLRDPDNKLSELPSPGITRP